MDNKDDDTTLIIAAAELRKAAYEFFRSDAALKEQISSGGTYGPPGYARQGLEAVHGAVENNRLR